MHSIVREEIAISTLSAYGLPTVLPAPNPMNTKNTTPARFPRLHIMHSLIHIKVHVRCGLRTLCSLALLCYPVSLKEEHAAGQRT
jgi:hypothetical protein